MRTSISITLLAGSLLLGPAALAAPQTPSGDASPVSQSTIRLQVEIDALNSMNDALGPMSANAQTRLDRMRTFAKDANLGDVPAASSGRSFDGLTFNQALQVAIRQQQLRGRPAPSAETQDTLEREVAATQTLVQEQWSRVNTLHRQVGAMTDFLSAKGKLDAYLDWAVKNPVQAPASDSLAKTDRAAKAPQLTTEERDAKIQQYQQHRAALQLAWDQEHAVGTDAPSNIGAPGYSPLGGPPSGGDQSTQGFPANQNDYYAGSYWNGYADPYWDVQGYRGLARAAAWHRYNHPQVAPGIGHPADRDGRR